MKEKREQSVEKPRQARRTAGRLLSYVTHSKVGLAIAILCMLLSVGCGLAGTYLLRPIINRYIYAGATDVKGLGGALLVLLAIHLLGAAASYAQFAIMVRLAQRGVNRLRGELFAHLQALPLSYFDGHTHGELMSRFTNDADNVQTALEQSVVNLLSSALLFGGIVTLMVVTNPVLFLATLLVLVATILAFVVLGGRSRKHYQGQQEALGLLNGGIQETIEGLRVVKAFTHEDESRADFARRNEAFRQAASRANFYSTAVMPVSVNLMNAGFALTAGLGGLLAVTRGFDLGGLVVYLNYSRQVGQPLNQISQQLTTVLSALAGAERIFAILDIPPEADQGTVTLERREGDWAWRKPADGALAPLRGAVELLHVDFSYVPGKRILKDISVYAQPGQKIAFVGSTGAGKTTITNLLNRFYEIEGGTITIDGIEIRDIKKDDLRRALGIVLQDTHLFTGTILDNIRYGRLDASDEDCIAAAKSANADAFIRHLPDGYHTSISGDGETLSQGQRQLLAIARAAVADPPVLILDEATSSIDTRTEQHIQQGMDKLMEGRTVFVIAHRLSTIRNADCIVVLEKGAIAEKGSHQGLLEKKGRYHQLYTGQFELS